MQQANSEPTLHDIGIAIIVDKIKNSVDNHHLKKFRVGLYVPDVVVFDEGEKVKELHEVEVVRIRSLPDIGAKRVLWFVTDSIGWDEFRVLPLHDKKHSENQLKHVINEKARLENEIAVIREKIEELQKKKVELETKFKEVSKLMREEHLIRLFTMLPFLEFRRSISEEKCVLCLGTSHLILDGGELGRYGLCTDCLDFIIKLEEKRAGEELEGLP